MKRPLRFVALLAAASAVVPFLPLYIERTMLRSWGPKMHDTIEWGWQILTLSCYWSNYDHFSPEQRPALWLYVNIALAFAYALLIALVIDRLLTRRVRVSGFKSGRS
jgi:hypothetical protein